MKNKVKLWIGVIIFVFFILAAYFFYGNLSKMATDKKGNLVAVFQEAIDSENSIVEEVEPVYLKLSVEEAYELMKSDGTVVLDVRTQQEFEESYIPGAILIPDYEIKETVEQIIKDKETIVLVYCRSGRRSELAAKDMVELGYSQVYDFGGIIDWPYETI